MAAGRFPPHPWLLPSFALGHGRDGIGLTPAAQHGGAVVGIGRGRCPAAANRRPGPGWPSGSGKGGPLEAPGIRSGSGRPTWRSTRAARPPAGRRYHPPPGEGAAAALEQAKILHPGHMGRARRASPCPPTAAPQQTSRRPGRRPCVVVCGQGGLDLEVGGQEVVELSQESARAPARLPEAATRSRTRLACATGAPCW